MGTKIHNKNINITKVSRKHEMFELIEAWKKTWIKEVKMRNNAVKTLASFKEWYLTYLKACELDDKVEIIYGMFANEETKTDEQKDWLQERSRAITAMDDYFNDCLTVHNLFKNNEKKIKQYLRNKELSKYKTKIELDFYQGSKHTLNEQNERIDDAIGGIEPLLDIYRGVMDDTPANTVYDKNGKAFKRVSWHQLFTHKDEQVRQDTYKSYYSPIEKHRRTLMTLMYYIWHRTNQMAKMRNYKSEIDWKAGNYYHISLKNYMYIIDQSEKFAQIHNKYKQYFRKIIAYAYGLKEYKPWDKSLEIENISQQIDITTAKQVALNTLSCLGQDYVDQINKFYKKDLIKWEEVDSQSKNGGCFSGVNTLDENPIIIKWDGTMGAAITLSHELGHNLKNFYTKQNNEINNRTEKIASETPSMVNQFLTIFYLLDKYRKEKNVNYLYGVYKELLSYYFANVSRAGLNCQFRVKFVNHCIKDGEIKPLMIERIYWDCKKRYYGLSASESKTVECGKTDEWLERMDAYTTYILMERDRSVNYLGYYLGAIVGLVTAYKIYNGDKKTLSKYLKFLKQGNDTNPFTAFKVLGVDVLKPQIYTESKHLIEKLVNQFIKDVRISQPKQTKESKQ